MPPNEKLAALTRDELSEVVHLQAERPENSPSAQAEQQTRRGHVSAAVRHVVGSVAFGGGEVRVSIATVKGVPSVDVRSFQPFVAHAPKLLAAGRGVTLPLGRALELSAMIVEAEDQARAMGLIGGDE